MSDDPRLAYKGIYWCGDCSDFNFHTGRCEQGCDLKESNRAKGSHFPKDCPFPDAIEIKHGYWSRIHIKGKDYGKVYYQHENCAPLLYENPYHYCPECGAMMDEEMIDK